MPDPGAGFARAGRGLRLDAFVHPLSFLVLAFLRLPSAEEAVVLLGVLEIFAQDCGGVRVIDDVLLEVALVLEDVVNDAAEERDVAARAHRDVNIRHGAGAREPRIDVDDRRAALLRLHHPAEADRVALRHIRALDDDAVRVLQILLERGRAASAERCPQTGDGGGVSNTSLIFDLNDPERVEELLDEIVLLVVEGRAAKMRDGHRAPEFVAFLRRVFPVRVARRSSPAPPPCPSPARAGSAPTTSRAAGGRARAARGASP